MYPTLKHFSLVAFENMSPRDASAVLASARTLQRAAQAGTTQPLLRGKNLGLLCEADDDLDAALFRRAGVELGAHVAHIRPSLSELSTPQEVQHTARMLGRFYDAVECQGMAPALVEQVGTEASVPVYDGIASQDHPTAKLAELLGDDASPADNRRFVLQAVLLSTIA
jgi:ornithine carbamoyltransferase